MTNDMHPGSDPIDQPEHPSQRPYAYPAAYPAAYSAAPYGWAAPPPPPAAPARASAVKRTLVGAGAAVVAAGLVLSGFTIADATMSGSSTTATQDPAASTGGSTAGGSGTSGTSGLGGLGGSTGGFGGSTGGFGGSTGGFGGSTGSGTGSSGAGSSTGSSTGQTSAQVATSTQQSGIVTVVSVLKYQNEEAAGTGMVLTSDGEILTNNHVIDGATSVTVTVKSTGKSYTASVVGTDATDDVAVLQLNGASGLTTAKVGDSSDVSVGDAVSGVGNAGGTGTLTVASGTVTALDQSITASDEDGQNSENLTGLIETNAGIMAGDSGGPLYDADGTIIGMDTAGASASSTQAATQAYAIPIDTALTIAGKIESGVQTTSIRIGLPAFLGVSAEDSTTSGAAIASVVDGGPADDAGIAAGSVITAVGGKSVSSAAALGTALGAYKPGQKVSVTWTDADGSSHTATVTLISGPAA